MKNSHTLSQLTGLKVLIYGLGLQGGGTSAAKFFAQWGAKVRVTDLKNADQLTSSLLQLKSYPIEFTLGTHQEADFLWADKIIVNPDIFNRSADSTYLQLAKQYGKALDTEIGVFFDYCACPMIGITGTRGKTTTTHAINHLLQAGAKRTFLGGNIPNSDTLFRVEETKQCDFAVLELSNYQLRGLHFKKCSPHIAVVTSLYPDHLNSYAGENWEQKMTPYIADKLAITNYQTKQDSLIVKKDPSLFEAFTSKTQATVYFFDGQTVPGHWQLQLLGAHNRENLGAAYCVGELLDLPNSIIKQSLTAFRGVPYRLEKIGEKNEIQFINDTTATTPVAAEIALKSFPVAKIIWIAGGNSKQLPYEGLMATAGQRVKAVVFLQGDETTNFRSDLTRHYPQIQDLGVYSDFDAAVNQAYKVAGAGDTILLSPGFTSFGMFENEFDRGQQFNQIVFRILGQ